MTVTITEEVALVTPEPAADLPAMDDRLMRAITKRLAKTD